MIGKFRKSRSNAVPGFGLSLGFTLAYLSFIVLIPLCALVVQSTTLGWQHFYRAAASPRVMASYRLTIGTSLAAAAINTVAGLFVAWVLARYRFPGKRIVDALVDCLLPADGCRRHRAYFALCAQRLAGPVSCAARHPRRFHVDSESLWRWRLWDCLSWSAAYSQ